MIIPNRDILLVRPIKIAQSLSENGYSVKILAWDVRGEKAKIEQIKGCKIHNFRFKVRNRVMLYLSHFMVWWPYVFLFLLRDDSNIFQPYNFFVLIPTLLAKIIKRRKLVYDLADFCSEALPPTVPNFVRGLLSWLERFCLFLGADAVIIVDEHRRKHLEGVRVKRLEIVMNCPRGLSDKFEIRKKRSAFIVYYGGWLSERRGLRQLIRAIHGLDDVELIVAGFGPDEWKLKLLFDAARNVDYVGMVNYEKSIEYTSEADVVFAFYDPRIPINRLASPNKLFDAMMCGKPVIVNSEAIPAANIVRKVSCGLIVPYDDVHQLRDAILELKENRNLWTKFGENGREAFEREYNWKEMEHRLLRLYRNIFHKA